MTLYINGQKFSKIAIGSAFGRIFMPTLTSPNNNTSSILGKAILGQMVLGNANTETVAILDEAILDEVILA